MLGFRSRPKTRLHMETRFHPAEYALLDRQAALLGVSIEDLLRYAVLTEARRRQSDAVLTRAERDQAWKTVNTPSLADIADSEIVVDEYLDPELIRLVDVYRQVTGCRTRFAVPRHAVVCELQREGLLPPDPPPVGFGCDSFA
jgi:hypothetical protein